MTLQWPSTSRAEDAAVLALSDVSSVAVAAGVEHRIIGGTMTTFHTARYATLLAPRVTADADTGITPDVGAAHALDGGLRQLGYQRVDGSRYIRKSAGLDLVIDLLVDDSVAGVHNVELGPLSVDAAPGLSLALARPPWPLAVDVTLTTGQMVSLDLALPDSSVSVVMKALAWEARFSSSDALDTFRLLEVWSLEDPPLPALRRGVTVARAEAVLSRHFLPTRGAASGLPPAQRTQARLLVRQFLDHD